MELEEAKKLLEEEEKKANEAFINEYRELCIKHGRELVPAISFNIVPLKR